ncbi:retrovirus-related pol polyprotein from transposon TNT 1-94 [Tanacetum coccineum]
MVVQDQEEMGEGSTIPTDPHHTPTIIQPSPKPQKKQKPRKPKRKDTQIPQSSGPTKHVVDEAVYKELDILVCSLGTTSCGVPKHQEPWRDTIAQKLRTKVAVNDVNLTVEEVTLAQPAQLLKKGRIVGIKRLLDDLRVTAAQLAKQGLVKGLPKLKYTKDYLCSACQMGKSKKEPHPHKLEPSTNEKLQMLNMDLCRPMRVASINRKRYILVIVDSRFTRVKFLRIKDETPEIIIKILKQAQVSLNATVRYLRADKSTEFINQTLRNYMENVGITHHRSIARTPQQNGVVERRNYTLVEAIRTMLIFSKYSFFLWAEAVAIACYTQNCSIIHPRYNKTPYELLRDRKPKLKYLHVFGALCYPTNNFEDLGKLQPKADIGIFIGYSPCKKAYQIYNKRTRLIMETMNIQFDKLTKMASEQHGSGPELQGMTSGHISSGLYFKPLSDVSTTISVATLPPPDTAGASSSTTIDQDAPSPSTSPNNELTSPSINSTNVKEPNNEEEAEFDSDTFTNPFASLETSSVESSSRIVDTSNINTF